MVGTQARDVTDRGGKSLLYDVERSVVVPKKFSGVGVKRELMPLKQGIPSFRHMLAGCVKKIGVGSSHDGAL
jgi:hypothetical protein